MTTFSFLASALLTLGSAGLAAQGPPGISPEPPPSQTFISGAQVVIDDAIAVDIKADDAHIAGPVQQLRSASNNLANMASTDREKEIAAAMKDMIFQISSCHIQAIDGASTDKCEAQIRNAERQAMDMIDRHKQNGEWVAGPPA